MTTGNKPTLVDRNWKHYSARDLLRPPHRAGHAGIPCVHQEALSAVDTQKQLFSPRYPNAIQQIEDLTRIATENVGSKHQRGYFAHRRPHHGMHRRNRPFH